MPVLKVWSADRQKRKAVVIQGYTVQELEKAAREKFQLEVDSPVHFCLESDGTGVDEDEVLEQFQKETKVVLVGEEEWRNATSEKSTRNDDPKDQHRESLEALLAKIRKQKPSKAPQKRLRSNVNIHTGWHHYDPAVKKFIQVRSQNGGGARKLDYEKDATYQEVLSKAGKEFFPDGSNHKGSLRQMTQFLANFNGEKIPETDFTAGNFALMSSATQKPRLYLFTKKKPFATPSSSSEDTSSDELPSLTPKDTRGLNTEHTAPAMTVGGSSEKYARQAQMVSLASQPMQTGQGETMQTNYSQRFAFPSPAQFSIAGTQMRAPPAAAEGRAPPDEQQQSSHLPQSPSNSQSLSTSRDFTNAGTPTISFRKSASCCCVCWERPVSAFFTPCGHTACMVCGLHIMESSARCHTCRGLIHEVKDIYFSG